MRLVILTAYRRGTASYCLPDLLQHTRAEIVHVIHSEGRIARKKDHYRRKLRKMLKIGLPGALNGIRMRKWYHITEAGGRPIGELETICRENNIPFTSVPAMNGQETRELLNALGPDLALSLGNSYISPKVFSIPKYGTLNLHGEVLPDYQNAQSVIWQLYNGSNVSGYTLHKMEKKIDAGEILKQEIFPIIFEPTLGRTVTATCAEILRRSSLGLVETVNHFEEYYSRRRPQGTGKSYTTPSLGQFLRILRNYKRLRGQQPAPIK